MIECPDEEESKAISTKYRINNGEKKFYSQNKSADRRPNSQRKKVLSNVQCFGCCKFGHYKNYNFPKASNDKKRKDNDAMISILIRINARMILQKN